MTDTKDNNILAMLHNLFAEHHDLRAQLLNRRQLVTLNKNEYLWRIGESASSVWLQLSGFCQISQVLRDGRLASIGIGAPGDILGEAEVILRTARANEVVIRESASFLQIDARSFGKSLQQWPALAGAMLAISNAKFLGMIDFCAVMQTEDVPTRCAYLIVFLGDLCGESTGPNTRIPYRISQDALASLAGTSRQTLNVAINHLRQEGIIRYEQGQLTITNQHKLEMQAGCRAADQRLTKSKMMALLKDRLAGNPASQ